MGLLERDVTVMREKAQTLTTYQTLLLQYVEEIQSTAQGLVGHYEGGGSEEFQNAVSQDIAQMKRLHETFGTFITTLNQDIERTEEFIQKITARFTER